MSKIEKWHSTSKQTRQPEVMLHAGCLADNQSVAILLAYANTTILRPRMW